jgi:hypothetical protein
MKSSETYVGFVNEALEIAEAAKKQGIVLRLIGALAIRYHCPKFANLHRALEREFTDIDFIGYPKQKNGIEKALDQLGYKMRMLSYSFVMGGRLIFTNEQTGRHVDVFLDKLDMCHVIDFKGRLEVDYPTIPLAELLLEKMQIVKIGEKDIKDTIVLIREHEPGDHDQEKINIDYIAKQVAKDWGFYYTITTNLNKVKLLLHKYSQLSDEDKEDVTKKIEYMLARIEKEPKTVGWKMRAKVGPKKKWYKEVDTPKA